MYEHPCSPKNINAEKAKVINACKIDKVYNAKSFDQLVFEIKDNGVGIK